MIARKNINVVLIFKRLSFIIIGCVNAYYKYL